jgi:hypothetical protein
MQNSFSSIPFKTKTDNGLSHIEGIAKFSAAGIILEFESKLFGILKGSVKEVRVPIGEILDVNFRKEFFRQGAKIEIRTKSFSTLSELPYKNGRLTLKLHRSDHEAARTAVEKLNKDIVLHTAQLPPTQTPVSSLFDPDDSEDTTRQLPEGRES